MILEGSELKLLDDLIDLPIKFIQIELINYNSVEQNVNFWKASLKNIIN